MYTYVKNAKNKKKKDISGKHGIYIIKNTINDKVYIGSSIDLSWEFNENDIYEVERIEKVVTTYDYKKIENEKRTD